MWKPVLWLFWGGKIDFFTLVFKFSMKGGRVEGGGATNFKQTIKTVYIQFNTPSWKHIKNYHSIQQSYTQPIETYQTNMLKPYKQTFACLLVCHKSKYRGPFYIIIGLTADDYCLWVNIIDNCCLLLVMSNLCCLLMIAFTYNLFSLIIDDYVWLPRIIADFIDIRSVLDITCYYWLLFNHINCRCLQLGLLVVNVYYWPSLHMTVCHWSLLMIDNY